MRSRKFLSASSILFFWSAATPRSKSLRAFSVWRESSFNVCGFFAAGVSTTPVRPSFSIFLSSSSIRAESASASAWTLIFCALSFRNRSSASVQRLAMSGTSGASLKKRRILGSTALPVKWPACSSEPEMRIPSGLLSSAEETHAKNQSRRRPGPGPGAVRLAGRRGDRQDPDGDGKRRQAERRRADRRGRPRRRWDGNALRLDRRDQDQRDAGGRRASDRLLHDPP